jgi:hypothetical protein
MTRIVLLKLSTRLLWKMESPLSCIPRRLVRYAICSVDTEHTEQQSNRAAEQQSNRASCRSRDTTLCCLCSWSRRMSSHNLYPGVAKTLSFRKPYHTRSAITFHTALYNINSLPGILYGATTLQHKVYNLIVCRKGRSWRAEKA